MGKVVLITGASSGLGKAIALYLVSKNYHVYGTTRNLANYKEFKDFPLLQVNVTNPETITAAISTIISKHKKIDVLINNAGVGITGAVEETATSEVKNAFETNFYGVLNTIREVLPQMRTQQDGFILNITSIAGYMGLPYRGAYSATKGALELVTESLRLETKQFGIRVACLAPGDFSTNIAAGRFHAPVAKSSPYFAEYSKTLKTINNDVQKGGDPDQVAHKVFKIINTKNPKTHYKVGSLLQKFSIVLKRILPDTLFEAMLLKYSSD